MKYTEPVMITREYIMKHRTKRGAWTRVQILALGIEWPPTQGWIDEIVGNVLSPERAKEFETGKNTNAKKARRLPNLEDAIKVIQKHQDKLDHLQLAKLAVILANAKSRGKK